MHLCKRRRRMLYLLNRTWKKIIYLTLIALSIYLCAYKFWSGSRKLVVFDNVTIPAVYCNASLTKNDSSAFYNIIIIIICPSSFRLPQCG